MRSKSIKNSNIDELKQKYQREKLQHYITKRKLINAQRENELLKQTINKGQIK